MILANIAGMFLYKGNGKLKSFNTMNASESAAYLDFGNTCGAENHRLLLLLPQKEASKRGVHVHTTILPADQIKNDRAKTKANLFFLL